VHESNSTAWRCCFSDIENRLQCEVIVLGACYFSTFSCKQKIFLVFVQYKLFIYFCVLSFQFIISMCVCLCVCLKIFVCESEMMMTRRGGMAAGVGQNVHICT
jgi:hypothetical protein